MTASAPMAVDVQANGTGSSIMNGSTGGNDMAGGAGGSANGRHGSPALAGGGHGAASSGAQIRSRITVVCAECKRLKLKCDRRTPCGSCLKRDTVQRCHYSAAAAEKIDVQSLHNRILVLEAQITAFQTNPALLSASVGTSRSNTTYDRALLAVGQAGSSLSISLDDVSAIWLDQLDLTKDGFELQPVMSPSPSSSILVGDSRGGSGVGMLDLLLTHGALFKMPTCDPSSSACASAVGVTPQLVAQLPSEPLRSQLMAQLEATLVMHPSINFPNFKSRIEAMFRWADEEAVPSALGLGLGFGSTYGTTRRAEQRPSLSFFAAAAAGFAIGAQCYLEANAGCFPSSTATPNNPLARQTAGSPQTHGTPETKPPRPPSTSTPDKRRPASTTPGTTSSSFDACTPRTLYTLSSLAIVLHTERLGYASYDLDHLHVLTLHALFLLHAPADGNGARRGPEVAHELFPVVGWMVNVARMMGLGIDPDDANDAPLGGVESILQQAKIKREDGGRFTLFEKEMRRRLWWDVFYYDLFVSDCMGQPPLISDDAHTTQLPANVNDEAFGPNSTTLPPPHDESPQGNIAYFIQKCRLAQLVKSMKKRTFRDPTSTTSDLNIDAAVGFEAEVHQWLADLPDKFKLGMDASLSNTAPLPPSSFAAVASPILSVPSTSAESVPSSMSSPQATSRTPCEAADSPFLIAQRCELASVANRIVLKLFLPFLKRGAALVSSTGIPAKAPQQAVLATVNAAHTIVHASRVLHTVFRTTRPATYTFYPFARTLFDAAVIAAHNVIQQPQSIYARIAVEDLQAALSVLRDPVVSTGRGPVGGGVEGAPSEAVRIVEMLKTKAEAARSGSGMAAVGMKRKHQDVDEGATLASGFQLPFVGAGVVNAGSPQGFTPPSQVLEGDASTVSRVSGLSHRSSTSASSHSRTKYYAGDREAWGPDEASGGGGKFVTPKERASKSSSSQYPSIGIRVRSGPTKKEPSVGRSRANSTVSARNMPPSSLPQSSQTPTPSIPHPLSTSTLESNYRPPPQGPLPTSGQSMQQGGPDQFSGFSDDGGYSTVASPYDHVYGRASAQPTPQPQPQPPLHDPYGAGPSHPSPLSAGPSPHPYYSVGYPSASQHGEYDTAMSGGSMLAVMGISASTQTMDTSSGGAMQSVPNTPQDTRFTASPDKGALAERPDAAGAPLAFRHAPGPGHGQAQPPMAALQGPPQGWTDNSARYPWDGYTFWKGQSS